MRRKNRDNAEALRNATLPERLQGQGSFLVRVALQRVALRQEPAALRAAGHMALALPLVQVALLVGVLDAEPWQALLGAEGLVIFLLAAGQFKRANVEGKLAGFAITFLNVAALGVAGLTLGGSLLWITGVAALLPIGLLVFAPTRKHTRRNAWAAFAVAMLAIAAFCGYGRYALAASSNEDDPAARAQSLQIAWVAWHVRGGNGTERALLRLRLAQAAFDAGDYQTAFELADDGAFDAERQSRVPASAIADDLLSTLMRTKAQAYYNLTWGKTEPIRTRIGHAPMPPDILRDAGVRARWAW